MSTDFDTNLGLAEALLYLAGQPYCHLFISGPTPLGVWYRGHLEGGPEIGGYRFRMESQEGPFLVVLNLHTTTPDVRKIQSSAGRPGIYISVNSNQGWMALSDLSP